jgi:hypothetical protein
MNTYYVFNSAKIPMAEQLMGTATGGGFFDFKEHQKLIGETNLPLSNTQTERLRHYRKVLILETDFDDADAAIKAAAEAESEIFSTENLTILNYLRSPDNV